MGTNTPAPGRELYGFIVQEVIPLPELDARGVSLIHAGTGLTLFHIVNDDNENAFAFAFRTPPSSSNGVAHILEHSVLCGSERFPLKDPFVVLMKGSMYTYLNAWTYPDKTVYPAASVNRSDYFNILRVYGDAVFFPLLRPETFAQEGYHLEPVDPADPASRLAASGVVFNEMKGNYSSQRSIVAEWTFRSLFPDTPYGFDSGGEPAAILTLTYEGLKDFHRRYYHPSNCRILLYGDIPTEEQLAFLDKHFLSRFTKQPVASDVPRQPRFSRPIRLAKTYPIREGEDQSCKTEVTIAWLLPEVTDEQTRTAFLLLSEILSGHAGSPLRRALVESGLGQDYSSAAGFETDLKQMVFVTGLRGTEPDRAEKILETAEGVLRRLVHEGIPPEQITAAFHQVEFSAREITGGALPHPLRLFSRALTAWLHDAGPTETLLLLPALDAMKKRLRDHPRFLESMIETHLLKNPHRSLVTTAPDPAYMKKFEEAIAAEIEKIEAALDAEKRSALLRECERLRRFQETPDPEEVRRSIPSLTRDDLPHRVPVIETAIESLSGGVPLVYEPMFTNGIVYVDLALRVDELPERLLPYVPLFGRIVTGAGLPGKNYADVQQVLSLVTGGFSAHTETGRRLASPEAPGHLVFRLKALHENIATALELAGDLIRRADLSDTARLLNIVLEARHSLAASIVPRGSYHTLLRAGRVYSRSMALQELWEGLSQHLFLSRLTGPGRPPLDDTVEALAALRGWIMNNAPAFCNVTASPSAMETVRPALDAFVRGLHAPAGFPGRSADSGAAGAPLADSARQAAAEALIAAVGVGFTARVVPSVPYGSADYPADVVLGHLLDTGPLHEKVRVAGGAYGVSSFSYRQEGLFCFGSYRDPHLAETFAAFSSCLEAAARTPPDDDELVKAITSVVGRDERPLRPREKGYTAFHRLLYGINDKIRQSIRDGILSLTPAAVAERAAGLLSRFSESAAAVLTGREAWEKAKQAHPDLHFSETEISL